MENIEAMLCAYIEGDLDEAGRAEIEKHLQEHPQHRKLIEELIATRDLVRGLPHVHAPPDVGDSLRGQVERSILLDDAKPMAGQGRMRLNRWPQIAAVAAVFVLTGGLGIIVYKMVMPTFQSPRYTEVARDKTGDADSDQPGRQRSDPAEEQLKPDSTRDTNPRLTPSAELRDNGHAAAGKAGQAIVPAPAIAGGPAVDLSAVRRRLETSGYAAEGDTAGITPVYLVIDSPDPTITNDKIARFLNSNGITWMPIPDPATRPSPATLPSALLPATMDDPSGAAHLGQGIAGESGGVTTQPDRLATDLDRKKVPILPSGTQPMQAAVPSTLPTPEADRVQGRDATRDIGAATQPGADVPVQTVYVARRMTRRQADELRQSLPDAREIPEVQLVDGIQKQLDVHGAQSTTQPTDMSPPAVDATQPSAGAQHQMTAITQGGPAGSQPSDQWRSAPLLSEADKGAGVQAGLDADAQVDVVIVIQNTSLLPFNQGQNIPTQAAPQQNVPTIPTTLPSTQPDSR